MRFLSSLFLTSVLLVGCNPGTDVPETTTSETDDAVITTLGPATDFTLEDTYGNTHTLSDYQGEWVVLEWLNYDCPFVRKHYNGNNMQATQQRWIDEGVNWLAMMTNAPGEQGHFPPDEMNARTDEVGGLMHAVLYDYDGTVGRAYGARTTPQMVVINPDGEVLYNGAIDDQPSADLATLEGATNYVNLALEEAMAGEQVTIQTTQPYGCDVKYADEPEGTEV